MIVIAPHINIPENELQFSAVQASGPGGQNVNKVATAVQLRYDVAHSPSLPEDVRQRLSKLAGKRISSEGVLVIEARQYRTQEQNRQAAITRLVALIHKAAEKPKVRRATRPTFASRQRRLENKRQRSEIKRLRQHVGD
ncbi:MAG: alternative ribosome rescue aminoacyl-tRNA hydrolase ArfB [Chloroflexota bacterium]